MAKLIYIFIGGGVGAMARYGLSGLVHRFSAGQFPWGTFAVNLAGCYLIGILWSVFDRVLVSSDIRNMLLIGVIGAFTTFSTFTLETLNLIQDGEIKLAVINIVASNILGVSLVFLGLVSSRFVFHLMK